MSARRHDISDDLGPVVLRLDGDVDALLDEIHGGREFLAVTSHDPQRETCGFECRGRNVDGVADDVWDIGWDGFFDRRVVRRVVVARRNPERHRDCDDEYERTHRIVITRSRTQTLPLPNHRAIALHLTGVVPTVGDSRGRGESRSIPDSKPASSAGW